MEETNSPEIKPRRQMRSNSDPHENQNKNLNDFNKESSIQPHLINDETDNEPNERNCFKKNEDLNQTSDSIEETDDETMPPTREPSVIPQTPDKRLDSPASLNFSGSKIVYYEQRIESKVSFSTGLPNPSDRIINHKPILEEPIETNTKYNNNINNESYKNNEPSSSDSIYVLVNLCSSIINHLKNFPYKQTILGIIVAMVVFFVFGRILPDFTPGKSVVRNPSTMKSYDEMINSIKKAYPIQSSSVWANIESCFDNSILRSQEPAIILVVGDRLSSGLANDFSLDILTGIKSLTNKYRKVDDLIISPKKDKKLMDLIIKKQVNEVKMHLDTKLSEIFTSNDRIAQVNDIHLLPGNSSLLFYTYGDDKNAKFQGVIILMTLELNLVLSDDQRRNFFESSRDLTTFVENYLYDLWIPFIGDDQLRPLFTRIANNVIFINN